MKHQHITVDKTVDQQRRSLMGKIVAAPLAMGLASSFTTAVSAAPRETTYGGLNNSRRDFEFEGTFLNGAYMHPVATGAADAIKQYLDARLMNAGQQQVNMSGDRDTAIKLFGKLFNADADELAWIPSTTVAENLVVDGLGLHEKGSVVTDVYHFSGSLFMYNEFAKQGLKYTIVEARDQRIHVEDIAKAIKPDTRLIALTLVSNVAGFEHDLKAVCDMAHAKGVMVYADIIQAAGNTPIDLHGSGVDFAACSTYKWLMGDFGIGIMYARRDSQAALKRSQIGFRQEGKVITHYLPMDKPGYPLIETQATSGLSGIVGVGTLGNGAVAALAYSLGYLDKLGLDNIKAWRQPLLQQLQTEMPKLGFQPLTPVDSTSAIVSFAFNDDATKLYNKLQKAGVSVTVYRHYLRIAPSFYNSVTDIERLLGALK
ncbi:aminotransferase class V-fold PLP-dependent enzyme [Shewanella sp.]|uniref:aminotransferase class V-fold PLP-dependent enzyme n=1 Tax=Shewanella sp. TaxID=50422 RepID=UPI003A97999B